MFNFISNEFFETFTLHSYLRCDIYIYKTHKCYACKYDIIENKLHIKNTNKYNSLLERKRSHEIQATSTRYSRSMRRTTYGELT